MPLSKSVDTGISYESLTFPVWEAAVAAGATLDELKKLDDGKYPIAFQARLIAWYEKHRLVVMHTQEAVSKAMEREQKKRK